MDPLYVAAAAGTFLALVSFAIFFAGRRSPEADEVARRLSMYGGGGVAVAAERVKTGNPMRDMLEGMTSPLNAMLARSSHTGKLADDLQKANLRIKSSEWILAVAGFGVLIGALLAVRWAPIFFLIGPPAAWMLSGMFLRFKQGQRTRAFNNQLGDTIILLSNALKAGLSFAQALSTVSKNAQPPISEEFARATREIALGINVDDALQHMVERNKSEDFDLLVTAVQIQRVVGGNLAEILDTIAHTIRERVRITGEIRTLTAQARASGWIITILPLALAGILSVVSPSYFNPMWHDSLGWVMMGIGLGMIAIGSAIIRKIVKIEV